MILVTVCFISTADIAPRIPALSTSISRKGWRFRLGESTCYANATLHSALLLGTLILPLLYSVLRSNKISCVSYSIQYVKLIYATREHCPQLGQQTRCSWGPTCLIMLIWYLSRTSAYGIHGRLQIH